MVALEEAEFLSFQEYLDGELLSEIKYEYVFGTVYAMAGGSTAHSAIASNLMISLGERLQGKSCRPFNSDLKIRIPFPQGDIAYYPDLSVLGDERSQEDTFQENPTVIFEVLSPTTRRTDENEKKQTYLAIPSLKHYVLVDSERQAATIYSRGMGPDGGFGKEILTSAEDVIELPAIEVSLPLSEIYDGLKF